MGVLDTVARALIEVKADVTDAKKKLKDLQGTEKQLAEERIKGMQSANEGLDKWVDRLAKAGLALTAIGQIAGFVGDSIKTYGETLRLESAAGATNIEKLQDAFAGLVTRHEALTFAAQTQHGVIKLNQEQQETFAKAMVALTRAGFDQQEVYNKIKDAAVSLKTQGLDDLGISVAAGTTNAEKLKNTLSALQNVIKDNTEAVSSEAEDVQRLSTAWADAKESVEAYIGASFSKYNATHGKGAVSDAGFVNGTNDLNTYLRNREAEIVAQQTYDKIAADLDNLDNYRGGSTIRGTDGGGAVKFFEDLTNDARQFEYGLTQVGGKVVDFGEKAKAAYDKASAAAKALQEQQKALSNTVARQLTDALVKQLEAEQRNANMPDELRDQRDYFEKSANDVNFPLDIRKMTQSNPAPAKEKDSRLEKIFGPLDDFDKYQKAFETLTGAVGSAYDAWVTGSDSAGHAIKRFLGEAIMATGKQMLVEALKYGAYALAYSFVDPAAAAGYAASSAAFAAGAVVAGVVAHELGAGGSTSAPAKSGGSAGTSASGGAGSSAPQQKQAVIVIGEAFANDTPRMRQLKAKQLVDRAYGSAGFEDS